MLPTSKTSPGPVRSWPLRLLLGMAKWILAPLLAIAVLLAGFWFLFPVAAKATAQAAVGELLLRYIAFRGSTGAFQGGFVTQVDLRVPMRDGIHLATDLYLPASPGPHPTILIRSPYTKGEVKSIGEFFARYGFAVVAQDTRGRHASEGDFYPFRSEHLDGLDLTKWARQQPWCNGKLGGFGASYLGYTQWAMAEDNPDLASISPAFITANLYAGLFERGAFSQLTFLELEPYQPRPLRQHGRRVEDQKGLRTLPPRRG